MPVKCRRNTHIKFTAFIFKAIYVTYIKYSSANLAATAPSAAAVTIWRSGFVMTVHTGFSVIVVEKQAPDR